MMVSQCRRFGDAPTQINVGSAWVSYHWPESSFAHHLAKGPSTSPADTTLEDLRHSSLFIRLHVYLADQSPNLRNQAEAQTARVWVCNASLAAILKWTLVLMSFIRLV